jgi:hypothetical protein
VNLFKKLFLSLNRQSVRYLVVGGVAVNLYGIERSTADIDIAVVLDNENLAKLVAAARALGLKPKLPVELEDFMNPVTREGWVRDKHMRVFTLYDPANPFFLLDILIDTEIDFEALYERRTTVEFDEVPVPVIALGDLIRMKEGTGRPQDKTDAFYLRKIMEGWKDGD